jgi:hypothetical protein
MREGCLKEQKGSIGAKRLMADVVPEILKLMVSYYKSI